MKIVHLGGEQTVTGSCHLFQVNGLNILVDCGLAQGCDLLVPMDDWPVVRGKLIFCFSPNHFGSKPFWVKMKGENVRAGW